MDSQPRGPIGSNYFVPADMPKNKTLYPRCLVFLKGIKARDRLVVVTFSSSLCLLSSWPGQTQNSNPVFSLSNIFFVLFHFLVYPQFVFPVTTVLWSFVLWTSSSERLAWPNPISFIKYRKNESCFSPNAMRLFFMFIFTFYPYQNRSPTITLQPLL